MKLHIGIDDTDSIKGGCTTYICALLVERLDRLGAQFIDYPNLVRLNPNIPWKTRGNGAVCIRVEIEDSDLDQTSEVVLETVERWAELGDPATDPGVVFHRGEIPDELMEFSRRTIQDLVTLKLAKALITRNGSEAIGYKTGRGIIGALAAVGNTLQGDHTCEIIAYRLRRNWGTPRKIDVESVRKMDQQTYPFTFNNVDPETGRVLITPRGPDPILFGIRGESPEIVKKAFRMVKAREEIERWVIFRCNHGTDVHLRPLSQIGKIMPYRPVIVTGRVAGKPTTITGRHVIFKLMDASGQVDCAAYEPTGSFRNIVRELVDGDLVEAYGGVRRASSTHPRTINLEKIKVLELKEQLNYENPRCPECGKRMESAGKNQGLRCRKCRIHHQNAVKLQSKSERRIMEALYIPPPRAHRHLTKPYPRYGRERGGVPAAHLIRDWHRP